jgi:environmental stress-induced protein Ves
MRLAQDHPGWQDRRAVSPNVTRLDPRAYRRTPWKNGGGVTVDIADAYAPGVEPGAWHGMLWRVGHTRIVAGGPFSDLAGYDRILTVIGGRGLLLDIEHGATLDVREPFRPVRFRGEDRIVSRLEAGPVRVLNLLADRTRYAIDVVILNGGDAHVLDHAIHIAYALENSAVAVDGASLALADDEALRVEGAPGRLAAERGRVALAMISSRSVP